MSSIAAIPVFALSVSFALFGCTDTDREITRKPNALDSFKYVPSKRVVPQSPPNSATPPAEKEANETEPSQLIKENRSFSKGRSAGNTLDDFKHKSDPRLIESNSNR